jgi:hypothetical protein
LRRCSQGGLCGLEPCYPSFRGAAVKIPFAQGELDGLAGTAYVIGRAAKAAAPGGATVKICAYVLAAIIVATASAALADEFQNVKCGGDIPKAMIGQHSPNERTALTEKKYQALGLKHLGADEISDKLSQIDWRICGAEYSALVTGSGRVGDVIPLPPHSKQSPSFSGVCKLNGKEVPGFIFGILDRTREAENLPALHAWKIDEKNAKFVKMPTEGLLCSKSGIYTVDGGL